MHHHTIAEQLDLPSGNLHPVGTASAMDKAGAGAHSSSISKSRGLSGIRIDHLGCLPEACVPSTRVWDIAAMLRRSMRARTSCTAHKIKMGFPKSTW